MNNILKTLIIATVITLFSGCVNTTSSIKPHEKAFEEEDVYVMFALRAEQVRSYDNAANIFYNLYERSDKKEYLYRSLQNELSAQNNQKVIDKVNKITKGSLDDFALIRLKIIALIGLDKLESAKDIAVSLVDKSNKVDDYLLVSEIYVKLKKYNTAVKYLESAYVKDYNEKILDKMAIVLYVNLDRKKDAIAQLETHSRVHGCSSLICTRLIGFYSNENNIDGLLSAYLRLYQINSNKEIAEKIVQIYAYKKDFIKMMDFLEESNSNDEVLLQIYINLKNYKKAYPLAYKLYKKTGETNYLGQSAIFEYEASDDNSDKEMQNSVIKKLKKVITRIKEGLYLNYLGYILIDHNLDVKKGMEYIQESLRLEPKSSYYLDSLAWGYYKLGDCKNAKKTMDRVIKLGGGDNEEVKLHVKTINKCSKTKKGK